MDGVLVDNEPKNLEQLKGFYRNYEAEVDDAFIHSLVDSSYTYTYTESVWAIRMGQLMEKFKKRLGDYYKLHTFEHNEALNPEVKETLIWLRGHDYRTAVASSSVMHQTQAMENVYDLVDCFDELLSDEIFHESKPNPEIYLTVAKKPKVRPKEYIAVESNNYGATVGSTAGMHVLAYVDDCYGVDQSKTYARIHHMQEIKKYPNGQENGWFVW